MAGTNIYGELIRAQLQNSAGDLTPTATGLFFYHTTDGLKWYTGAAWKTAADLNSTQAMSGKTFTTCTLDGASNTISNINLASQVTGTLPIGNGGTGQTTQTAAFDALSPTTTKGDLIVYNGSDNVRFAAGTDTYALIASSGTATGLDWAAVLTNPMDSAGDMVYGGVGGTPTKLDSGSAGQLLMANGAAAPTWVDTITTAKTFSADVTLSTNLVLNNAVPGFSATDLGYIGSRYAGYLLRDGSGSGVNYGLNSAYWDGTKFWRAVANQVSSRTVWYTTTTTAASYFSIDFDTSTSHLVDTEASWTNLFRLSADGVLSFGPTSSDATVHSTAGSMAYGTSIPSYSSANYRYIGTKYNSLQFRQNGTAGGHGFWQAGLYYDGTNHRYTTANQGGCILQLRSEATSTNNALEFFVGTSFSAAAGDVASVNTALKCSYQGACTIGLSGTNQTIQGRPALTTATNYTVGGSTSLTSANLTTSYTTDGVLYLASSSGGAFSVHGLAVGSTPTGGLLVLYNNSGNTMTLKHASGTEGTANCRIRNRTGADVTVPDATAVLLLCMGNSAGWQNLSS